MKRLKHYYLERHDTGYEVMHVIEQLNGTYTTPDIEIAKWPSERQKEIKSWHEINTDEVDKLVKQMKAV